MKQKTYTQLKEESISYKERNRIYQEGRKDTIRDIRKILIRYLKEKGDGEE